MTANLTMVARLSIAPGASSYVFLPFLYDEAGAKIREANRQFLETGGATRAG